MSDHILSQKRTGGTACACAALALLAAAASAPMSASAQSAAKAKAAQASAITPLPSTGAGISAGNPGNAPAPGGTALNPVLLYSGDALASGGPVQASSWGGGAAVDHTGDAYTSAGHTIQINTAGLYQGGQITFATPVTLGDLKSQTSRYLQIIFSAAASDQYPSSSGGYRTGSAPTQTVFPILDAHSQEFPGSYQIAQAPYRGGYRGRPRPTSPYGAPQNPYGQRPGVPTQRSTNPGQDEADELPVLAIGSLHVIYEYADGSRSETLRPISVALGEDINWLRASIPLSAIPASPSGSVQLSKLYIGTDVPATLNVGEIRLITDTTALSADAGTNKTVPVGEPVTLVGTGEGGASTLKYEWNFDSPSGQPFVPEAEGVVASYTFDTPGDHIVTLRVSDVDGIKQPATAVVTIHVEDQGTVAPGGLPGSQRSPYGMGRPPGMVSGGGQTSD